MPIVVKVPGGTATFPDGMDPAEIKAKLRAKFGEPQGVKQDIDVEYAAARPELPTSQFQGLVKAVTTPVRNVDELSGRLLENVGVDTGYKGRVSEHRRIMSDWEKESQPGLGGQIAGSIVESIPVMRAATASRLPAAAHPWLMGGATGALETEKTDVRGVLGDTATGAVAGRVGDAALRTTGALIRPQWRPEVNRMLEAGVPLTPGQIVGGTAHVAEDVASNVYGLGDIIRGAQRRAEDSAINAATNKSLAPVGRQLAPGVKAGHQGIAIAQKELSDLYDRVIPMTTLDVSTPKLARQFLVPLSRLHNLAQNLEPKYVGRFNQQVQKVGKHFGGIGRMSGRSFKQLDEMLSKEANDYRMGDDPEQRNYASAVSQLQRELRGALARSNPMHAKAITAIDEGYANLARVEIAAANAPKGRLTADQLRSATVQQDLSVRNRKSAAGTARMRQFAEDMDDTVGRTMGDTVGNRATINALLAGLLYGAGPSTVVNPTGLGALGLLAGAYTRRGGDVVRGAMTRRPNVATPIRRGVQATARSGIPSVAAAVIEGRRSSGGEE